MTVVADLESCEAKGEDSMDTRSALIAVALASLVLPSSAGAFSVTPSETVQYDFELNAPPIDGPYDRVGFEIIPGPELQLTAFDAWDVTLVATDGAAGPFSTARVEVDIGGFATSDDPISFLSFSFYSGVFPEWEDSVGRLEFSNSSGDYALGDIRIFFLNSLLDEDTRVYADISRVVVVPEPGVATFVLFGLMTLARFTRP